MPKMEVERVKCKLAYLGIGLLFAAGLLLALCGVAILIAHIVMAEPLSILVQLDNWSHSYNLRSTLAGIYLVILGLLAICSALYRQYHLAKLFTLLCTVNAVASLAGSTYSLFYIIDDYSQLTSSSHLEKWMSNYEWLYHFRNSSYNNATTQWDEIQNKLHCCGLLSHSDWLRMAPDKSSYPRSCCPNPKMIPAQQQYTYYELCKDDGPNIYRDGCRWRLESPLKQLALEKMVANGASLLLAIVGVVTNFGIARSAYH